jgi:hypothetical protein
MQDANVLNISPKTVKLRSLESEGYAEYALELDGLMLGLDKDQYNNLFLFYDENTEKVWVYSEHMEPRQVAKELDHFYSYVAATKEEAWEGYRLKAVEAATQKVEHMTKMLGEAQSRLDRILNPGSENGEQ